MSVTRAGRVCRSTLLAAVALGASLTLAACGSGSGSTSSALPPASMTGSGSAGGSGSGADLAVAAAKEGSLTWYTSFSDNEVRGVASAFTKAYPKVKVNFLQGSIDKLTARIGTEQKGGKYNADLVQGQMSYLVQLAKGGELQPYEVPGAAPPAGMQLPQGYRNVDFVLTHVIAYNPKALKREGLPRPTSYADFTKPAWRGKFSADTRDVGWYEALIGEMGHDAALQLVQKIGANNPRIIESHTQAVTQVESGEPVATIAAYGYKAAVFKTKAPGQLDFVNPNPLPASPDGIELVKQAPHPNAAKLFMNWLLSRAGQQALGKITGRPSLRPDVQDLKQVWDPSKWKPAWSQPTIPATTFNNYAQELQNALGAQ